MSHMVGLTATPAHFIDRDTFRVFQCDSSTPTFLYERHLVEADLYEPPLTVFGRNAVDRYFNPAEIRSLLEPTERLAAWLAA